MNIPLFHSQNGLYFGRLEDGSVRVIVTKEGKSLEDDGSNIEFQTDIPSGVWGSVAASVSVKGETYDTWIAAQGFHNDLPLVAKK